MKVAAMEFKPAEKKKMNISEAEFAAYRRWCREVLTG